MKILLYLLRMNEMDEQILVTCRANKREGIRLLFERYYRPLVLFAGELLHDDTMAEDVVQDFFVRLWEDDYICHVEAKALSSYLFTSVRNRCYTYLNKKDALRDRVDYDSVEVAADTASGMHQEIVDRVTEEIAKLPEQTGKVLTCILLEDKSYQQTADHLGVTINTVKTLLNNGMRTLRAEMQKYKDMLLLLHVFYFPYMED